MQSALLVAAIAAIALVSGSARAQSAQSPPTTPEHPPRLVRVVATLALTFHAGAERCDKPALHEVLHAEVSRRLGYDPFGGEGKSIGGVRIEITRAADERSVDGYSAKTVYVDTTGKDGEARKLFVQGLDAATCAKLFSSVATDIASEFIIFDEEPHAAPPPAPPPQPSSSTAAPPPAVPSPSPPPAPRVARIEVGASAHIAIGTAPHATPGGALHVGVIVGRFDEDRTRMIVALEGRVDAGVTDRFGVTTQLFAVSPVICASREALRGAPIRWGFLGCLLASIGAVRGSWQDAERGAPRSSPYAAVGARLGWEGRASVVAVRAQVDVLPTVRAARVVGESDASTVRSVSGDAGVAVVFPF